MKTCLHKFLLLAAFLGLIFLSLPSQADTVIPGGTITQNTTWTKANSPYVLIGDVRIRKSAWNETTSVPVLTIEPGTVVKFAPNVRLIVGEYYNGVTVAYGALSAIGTAEDPIVFTSSLATPSPGAWYGISVDASLADATQIQHCVVEYGGSSYGNIHGIYSTSVFTVKDSLISKSLSYGIYTAGNVPSTVKNCTVSNNANGVIVYNTSTVDSCAIQNNTGVGIQISTGLGAVIQNNVISNNGGAAITAPASGLWNVRQNSGTGNGKNYIEVQGGSITQNTTLYKATTDLPYVLIGDVRIRKSAWNETTSVPVLTIEPGTVVKFAPNVRLIVGEYYNGVTVAYGALSAIGTAEDPIVFTSSLATPSPGAWYGISVDASLADATQIQHCVVEYGGSSYGNIHGIYSTSVFTVKDSLISKSLSYGIYTAGNVPSTVKNCTVSNNANGVIVYNTSTVDSCAIQNNTGVGIQISTGLGAVIQNNVISNNGGAAITAPASGLWNVRQNSGTGNGKNYIEVQGGSITQNTTLYKATTDLPYVLIGDVRIRKSAWNETTSVPVLTIEPGTVVKFAPNVRLIVGEYYNGVTVAYGALSAIGTAEDPIVFTSSLATPSPGAWYGISVDASLADATQIQHCVVEYGGSSYGNIHGIYSTSVFTVKDSLISKSLSYGIYTAGNVPSTVKNCTVSNNANGVIVYNTSTVDSCAIQNNTGVGIQISTGLGAVIQNNVISNNGGAAITAPASGLWNVRQNSGTGNGKNYIEVQGGSITQNTTLYKATTDLPYVLIGDVRIRKSAWNETTSVPVLTIEPGTVVKFAPNVRLIVGEYYNGVTVAYGALSAIGTAEDPIVFTSSLATPSPGAWYGISVDASLADATQIQHCVVEYGGSSYGNIHGIYSTSVFTVKDSLISKSLSYGIYTAGNVPSTVKNCTVSNNANGVIVYNTSTVDSCAIQNNTGVGIQISTGLGAVIQNNVISNNGGAAITAPASGLWNVRQNSGTGNGKNYIEVQGGSITQNTTLYKATTDLPYVLIGDVRIRKSAWNETTSVPVLTIEPGTVVKFAPNVRLIVGEYYNGVTVAYGALSAIGTAEDPIVFTSSLATPSPGAWYGISVDASLADATQIQHCVVEYGGSSYGNIHGIYSTSVFTVKDSLISKSLSYGIYTAGNVPSTVKNCTVSNNANGVIVYNTSTVDSCAIQNNTGVGIQISTGLGATVQNNTISNGGVAISALASGLQNLKNNTGTGNTKNYIEVNGGTVTQNTTWHKTTSGLPYVLIGDVTVYGSNTAQSAAILTIEPGAAVRFASNTGLQIGHTSGYYGALSAQGTQAEPIVFTTNSATPTPGAWKGIYFTQFVNSAASFLEHCIIQYGGGYVGNVYLQNVKPTIQYCTIRNSSNYGILISGIGANGALIQNNNIKNNQYGVYTSGSAPEIHFNNFTGNGQFGVSNASATPQVNAENNWWGDVKGPNFAGDKVSGNVDFDPWLLQPSTGTDAPPTNQPPLAPENPNPALNAVRVPLNSGAALLSWTARDPNAWDTLQFDVYFAPSGSALALVASNLTTASYSKTGLVAGQTYSWKVLSRDNEGATAESPVWSFTTEGPPSDLLVTGVTVDPNQSINEGENFTFTAFLKNQGVGPLVDPVFVDFKIDGQTVGSQAVSSVLAAGQTLSVPLVWRSQAGQHTLEVLADSRSQAVESDESNNVFSTALPLVKDITPPVLVSTNPANGAEKTRVDSLAFVLSDQSSALDVDFVKNSFVIRDGANQAVSGNIAELNGVFTWTPALAPLADGAYSVSFTAKDSSGNTKDYGFAFTVDSVIPAAPGITGGMIHSGVLQLRPFQNESSKTDFVIEGTREDQTSVWVNGALHVARASGNWSLPWTAAQGANAFEIWAEDGSGNRSVSVFLDIAVDSIAPLIQSVSPANQSFLKTGPAKIEVSFSEESSGLDLDATLKSLVDQNGQAIAGNWSLENSTLTFTPTQPFEEALYTLSLTLKDRFGNEGTPLSQAFTVDSTPPPAPTVNAVTTPTFNIHQLLSGSKEAFASLFLNGQEALAHTAETTWQYEVSLSGGVNTLELTAQDRAGNESAPQTVEIVFDDIAPPVLNTLQINPNGNGTALLLNWSGYNEALHGDIQWYRIYAEEASFTNVSGLSPKGTVNAGNFTFTLAGLKRKTLYWLAVVPVDLAGNSFSDVSPLSATPVDVKPPEEVSNLRVECFENRLQLLWTAPPNSDLDFLHTRVYFNDETSGTELPAEQTTFDKTGLLPATAYPFRVTTLDEDGNESTGLSVTGVTWLPNPAGLSAEARDGAVIVSWEGASPGNLVKHYAVYRSDSEILSVQGLTPVQTTTGTQANITGLQNDTLYHFAVTTVNTANGENKTVSSISATPTQDKTGPQISDLKWDNGDFEDGMTLRKGASFSLSASDLAGISRVEFQVDENFIRTDADPSGGYSFFWNLAVFTDGLHVLKIRAYDTLGNLTSQEHSVTVTLDAPASAPVITIPSGNVTRNQAALSVSGTAEPLTQTVLFLNGTESPVNPAEVNIYGSWSQVLTLSEGANSIQAASRNRGGTGPLSTAVTATLDTALPSAPTGVEATAKENGVIRISWNGVGTVSGFNLFRSSSAFTSQSQAVKLNSGLLTGGVFLDFTPSDGVYHYRLTSVTALGNESELSLPVSAQSDNTLPKALSIDYVPQGKSDPVTGRIAPGAVQVTVNLSEPLQSTPFLSLTPSAGIPTTLSLTKLDDLKYQGFFNITDSTPSGLVYAVFSARDPVGNRGTEIDSGTSLLVDTAGPSLSRLVLTPASPLKNDSANPLSVNLILGLNENVGPGTAPLLAFRVGNQEEIPLSNLSKIPTQEGDLETWQATLTLPPEAGSAGTESLSFSYSALDDLDNLNTKILAPNAFQIYQGQLPPLPTPSNFKAKSLPQGQILLSWDAVPGSVGYQLYRRAPGETDLTPYLRLPESVSFTDSPSVEGPYMYAIASVREANGEESLSAPSESQSAEVDATNPSAPVNLTLQLLGGGVQTRWDSPASGEPLTFSLYRSAESEISSVQGLVPLKNGISLSEFLDASPSSTDHTYAVTAVDAAGNESLPSVSVRLNVSLLPVSTLQVKQADTMPPVLSWTHPGGDFQTFEISHSGGGQTALPLASLPSDTFSFVDSEVGANERLYSLHAKDQNGDSSLSRSVFLPKIQLSLTPDARLKRNTMNRLTYHVQNDSSLPLENLTLNAWIANKDHLSAPFTLSAGETRDVSVIVGGYADLPDSALLRTSLIHTLETGISAEIIRRQNIPVQNGVLALDLQNEEFTRGISGKARFTLQNTGDTEMEIVTANGTSPSNEILFSILDADGNVLSTAPYKQTLGDGLVSLANGQTVARILPGQTFSSGPVDIPVPVSAPDKVTLKLSIAKVHYHLGKADQVSLNGSSSTRLLTLLDTAYTGELLSLSPASSKGETPVQIKGRAVDRKTGLLLPSVPLKLIISVKGFERAFEATTEADGTFTQAFTPIQGEAGLYKVSVIHPSLNDRPEQGQFVIQSVSISPSVLNLGMPRNYTQTFSIQARTGEGTELHNLRLVYESSDQSGGLFPEGMHVTPGPAMALLGANQTGSLSLTLWADNTASETGTLIFKVFSDESPAPLQTITVNTLLSEAKPALYPTPTFLERGMARGDFVSASIILENKGLSPANGLLYSMTAEDGSPAPSWVQLSTGDNISSLAVGDKAILSLSFQPSESVPEGSHTFYLNVQSANHPAFRIPVFLTVSQSGKGNFLFKVDDIYTGTLNSSNQVIPGLSGASIQLQNELIPATTASLATDSLGEALFQDIPAGSYRYRVSAPDHQDISGRCQIQPGITGTQNVFLNSDLVTVEWSVTPTTIQDKYEISLNATFKTDVPAAVVVAEPASVNLPDMQTGDLFQGEFQIKNHGLISAEQLEAVLPPEDAYFKYEMLTALPEKLLPNASLTLPYRVTCLQSPIESLGTATGGGLQSVMQIVLFKYIYVCSNGFVGNDAAKKYIIYLKGQPDPESQPLPPQQQIIQAASGSGGWWDWFWGGLGGWFSNLSGQVKTLLEGLWNRPEFQRLERFFYDGEWDALLNMAKKILFEVGCSVDTQSRQFNDDQTDLQVKVPGGTVEVRRRFYDNNWNWDYFQKPLRVVPYEAPQDCADLQAILGAGTPEILNGGGCVRAPANEFPFMVRKRGTPYYQRSKNIFQHDTWIILKRDDGTFQWRDKIGNFEEYDSGGWLHSFGNRSGVLGTLIYTNDNPSDRFHQKPFVYSDEINNRLFSPSPGRVTGIQDRNGRQVIWYQYNDLGLLESVRDLENRTVTYTYHSPIATGVEIFQFDNIDPSIAFVPDGRFAERYRPIHKVRDVLGAEIEFRYAKGLLTQKIMPGGEHITTVTYDEEKDVQSVMDETGNGTTFQYDYDQSQRTYHATVSHSSGKVESMWYDRCGDLIRYDLNGVTLHRLVKENKNTLLEIDDKGRVTRKVVDEWRNVTSIKDPDGKETAIEYEHTFHQPVKIKNRQGILTSLEYDSSGNLILQAQAVGTPEEQVSTHTYNDQGQPLTSAFEGSTVTREYDPNGNLLKITDPTGNETRFRNFDAQGHFTEMENAAGQVSTLLYDLRGRLVTQTDSEGNSTGFEHNPMGDLSALVNPLNKRFEMEYDGYHRVTKAKDPLGGETSVVYDPSGNPLQTTDAEGRVSQTAYDSAERLVQSTDGAGNSVRYVYDAGNPTASFNQPVEVHYPTYKTQMQYDLLGRVIRETTVLDASTSQSVTRTFDAAGNVLTETDPENKTVSYEYDALSRPRKITDPAGGVTERFYDRRGNLEKIRDPNGGETKLEYDTANRLTKATRPEGQVTRYEHNKLGQVKTILDSKGQKIEYEYTPLGKIKTARYFESGQFATPVKTVTFTYNEAGSLTGYDDGQTSASYGYDDLQRRISETVNYGAFSLSSQNDYFKNSLPKSFTGPKGGKIEYQYDSGNRLATLQVPGLGPITVNSYRWNSPTQISLPGGTTHAYDYDPLMRLKGITHKTPLQETLVNQSYSYSPGGNLLSKNTDRANYQYQYDSLSRLLSSSVIARSPGDAAIFQQSNESYTYDALGNRLSSASTTGAWTYNQNNELLAEDVFSFQYDENGNLTHKQSGATAEHFVYDVENRLQTVGNQDGDIVATYSYDPFGRRLSKTVGSITTYFFYSAQGLIGEYDSSGNEIRSYGYAPGSSWSTDPLWLKTNGQYYYYQSDRQGTPYKLSDPSGHVVWEAVFDSFGNCSILTEEIQNPFRFPGQYFDSETGLYCNYHRYYDPTLGRYTQVDPEGEGLNLYAYVFSNPNAFIDPEGTHAIKVVKDFILDNYQDLLLEFLGGFASKVTDSLSKISKEVGELAPTLKKPFEGLFDKLLTPLALGLIGYEAYGSFASPSLSLSDKISQSAYSVSNGAALFAGSAYAAEWGFAIVGATVTAPVWSTAAGIAGAAGLVVLGGIGLNWMYNEFHDMYLNN